MALGWEIDPYGSHGARLTECLEAAALAPSVHNSQPWRLRISPGRIDVLLDRQRRLPAIDPTGREAWISMGAVILNLRMAILAAGHVPMTRLLPDPDEPDLAATIMISGAYRPDETVRALFTAVPRRRTNRRPFRDIEVRDEVLHQFYAAARAEGATLVVADPVVRESVLALVRTANSWGVLPLRDFDAAHPELTRRPGRFEDAPTLVVLYTTGDERPAWLRAGQAMERVLLTATVRGVANTPMTAPSGMPELRGPLDGAEGRCAQVILRLGYGDPVPATPRRPIRESVDVM